MKIVENVIVVGLLLREEIVRIIVERLKNLVDCCDFRIFVCSNKAIK